jgi:hypothetical protein
MAAMPDVANWEVISVDQVGRPRRGSGRRRDGTDAKRIERGIDAACGARGLIDVERNFLASRRARLYIRLPRADPGSLSCSGICVKRDSKVCKRVQQAARQLDYSRDHDFRQAGSHAGSRVPFLHAS